MAGVRSQRCIRIVSSVRILFCGTGLVVVVIFFFLVAVAVAVFFCVWRDHLRRRGGDERVELLLGVVEDRAELRVEVPKDPVVGSAQRVDVEGDTGVGVAVLALAQVGGIRDLLARGRKSVAAPRGGGAWLGA